MIKLLLVEDDKSIVLFVSASSFTDYLTEAVDAGISTKDYEIYCNISEKSLNGKSADELLQVFTSEKNVTDVAYTVINYYKCCITNQTRLQISDK